MSRKLSNALMSIMAAATIVTGMSWSMPVTAVEPYIGTIRYFAFNFAPRGWAHCDGQLMAVNENDALFSLFGTIYGGDGRTTFGLPDMRGRAPIHQGSGPGLTPRPIGQRAGAEQVALTANQIGHSHTLMANTGAGNQSSPTNNSLAQDTGDNTYRNEAPSVAMHADSISTATGGGQRHENMPPFLGVYCNVALVGVYPSRH